MPFEIKTCGKWQKAVDRIKSRQHFHPLGGVDITDFMSSDKNMTELLRRTRRSGKRHQDNVIDEECNYLIKKVGNVDEALLHVIESKDMDANKVYSLVINLIHQNADVTIRNSEGKTVLLLAIELGLNFNNVAVKLLDHDAITTSNYHDGIRALKETWKNENDEVCAKLMDKLPNDVVRKLFLAEDEKNPAQFSFHELLKKKKLQATLRSVLDCMIEPSDKDGTKVYYSILECDEAGRTPGAEGFNPKSKSPLQKMAKKGNKNIVYHDTVRLLIRHKWHSYALAAYRANAFQYILSLFCITYSAIGAVLTDDPVVYDTDMQMSRAVLEVISLLAIVITLVAECDLLRRHRGNYFKDGYNWFDFSSSMLLIAVVPLRFLHRNSQWYVFALGYVLWTIRIFKFGVVFRQTGAYIDILARILMYDFTQFGIVFLVILLAFSGSFFLSLRGDGDLFKYNETSTFWNIVFVGVRSLIEAQPIVEYAGEDGYGTVSMLFMLGFLFTCIVLLLNILIAQMTDTYQKVQQDAQRRLEMTRAWIVACVELNSCFLWRCDYRGTKYKEFEIIPNIDDALSKWDTHPVDETHKYVRDIWEAQERHSITNRCLLNIQEQMENRLGKQEATLEAIWQQLCKNQDGLHKRENNKHVDQKREDNRRETRSKKQERHIENVEEDYNTALQEAIEEEMYIPSESRSISRHDFGTLGRQLDQDADDVDGIESYV